jgi:CubicO group peptidase (beta-lactamase class C family)
MLLVQQGRMRLVDRVAKYLPAFAANRKQDVNIAQLLTHTSGLAPDLAASEYHTEDLATILAHTNAAPLRSPPGTKFAYSDLGYIVLAQLVARISGEPYDRFVDQQVFAPLGMRDSSIGAANDSAHAARVAPQTRNESAEKLRQSFGTIPGMYGHAGMLTTAGDLAKFAVAELRALRKSPDPNAPLAPATVRAMISPRYVGGGAVRGLGWDLDSPYSNNRGDLLPRGGFGHTGSSGTSMWIDPALDVGIIFVSNAHYPDDIGTTLPLEGEIADVVASSLRDVDPRAIRAEEQAFDAAAARSALGFPRGF